MDFTRPYSRDAYLDFFRNRFLPDDFETADEEVSLIFSPQYTEQASKIGRSGSLGLNVYEIRHRSQSDPRVSLSKESFRLLAQYGQNKALILFVSEASANYRLSLVTIDLKWEDGKRPTREYSNPKRLSFLLGPGAKTHTPEQYLADKGRVSDFDDLKSRFSIEVVNKDFYTQIAVLFTKLTGGERKIGSKSMEVKRAQLVFPSPDDTIKKEFAVRLIGRLIFCWFLQKKHSDNGLPLLPEEILSSGAVAENRHYYHSILEPLFFEVLNTPMTERAKCYRAKPWSAIPFLNGGLFTPHDDDFVGRTEQEKAQRVNTLVVPNDWLKELVEVFETYNFTIDENTPVDIELSIEPEMLGRIFENLLAEINPETGETARKATGSYYTPRPIVEYMVDESLKQYLVTKTGLPEAQVTSLLSYAEEEPGLSNEQKDMVINALDTIKVIDPACGSGAFPIGILQKIVLVLQKLDPDSKRWLARILARIDDPIVKRKLQDRIDQPEYLHKLGIIRDCIFGVDIQPIAVEISKLRCFLSLIVNEKVDDSKENRGIEHLPNLEFKFVCANTLIGLPKATTQKAATSGKKVTEYKDQTLIFEANKEIDELRKLRSEYLNSSGHDKERLEREFRRIQSRMSEHSINWGGRGTQTLRLSAWNPFSDEPCDWFDPEWMFGIRDRFNVVIANPPYVDSETMTRVMPDKRRLYSCRFDAAKGNWDLFVVFIECGINLLREHAVITYIVPNKLIAAAYTEALRRMLLDKAILELRDLSDVKVFKECDVYPVVFVVQNNKQRRKVKMVTMSSVENVDLRNEISPGLFYEDIYWDKFYASSLSIEILERMSTYESLGALCPKIVGAATVNEAYELKKFIVEEDGLSGGSHLKLVNTGTIDRYVSQWGKRRTRYIKDSYERPVISEQNLSRVSSRRHTQAKSRKVIIAGMSKILECYLDEGDHVAGKSTVVILNDPGNKLDLQALTAILNSKAVSFWYKVFFNSLTLAGGYLQISTKGVKRIPIPHLTEEDKATLASHANTMQSLMNSRNWNQGASNLQKVERIDEEIDHFVYNLYRLTSQEIKHIESRR